MDRFLDIIFNKIEPQWYRRPAEQASNEIWLITKKPPTKKSPGLDGIITEFYQIVKEELMTILKLFQKINREPF